MIETRERKERAILIAVDLGDGTEVEASLAELAELADTAGAETVGTLIQNREAVHAGTYIGKGKIEELRELIHLYEADTVISDDELSPAQIGNLQEELGCKVIDRTVLILDIFAAHASTSEGKLQVELAQLRYRASRLTGLGKSLEDYDMLIIGFASEYYDLYNSSNRKSQYAVDAINLFIDSIITAENEIIMTT